MTTLTRKSSTRRAVRRHDRLESISSISDHRIDRQAGIIRHVKILGEQSINGLTYPRSTRSDAMHLYEDARVFIDHPSRANPGEVRSFRDLVGTLHNITDELDGLYGDLHLLTGSPNAERILEAAEKAPTAIGLSHNAITIQVPSNTGTVVTAIERVRSVDVVTLPATTQGLFESAGSYRAPHRRGATVTRRPPASPWDHPALAAAILTDHRPPVYRVPTSDSSPTIWDDPEYAARALITGQAPNVSQAELKQRRDARLHASTVKAALRGVPLEQLQRDLAARDAAPTLQDLVKKLCTP